MSLRKLLLRTIVGGLCATAAVAILVLLTGSFDDTSWRILGTTTAISFFGLLVVPVGLLLERGRAVLLARATAALILAGFVLTLVVLWHDEWSNELGKTWGVVMTLTLAGVQASAVETRRRDSDSPTVARLAGASMVTGAVGAAMGVLAILSEIDDGGYYRLLGAVVVLDVLLVSVVAVLRRAAGPIAQTHRLRVDGRLVELPGRDFAAAVATAIRQAEREGSTVKRVERG